MNDVELWRRAQAVFWQALEVPEAQRDDLVRRACGDNVRLTARVNELLARDRDHASDVDLVSDLDRFLLEEEPRQALDDGWVGRKLGSYRVVGELGRGGMGEVYLAEREGEDFEQRVAIKRVRVDLQGAESAARFRRERQVLARLDHPNIARLLGGGSTEQGAPYLVMELVEGESILDYCEEQKLTLTDRIELFMKVCDGVHFAHKNLVVHRDIKASNVLVGSDRQPKLLDFGIAKLMDAEPGAYGVTQTHAFTRAYASPEQQMGESVTTASDVYSLGILLFELLVGRRPEPPRLGRPVPGGEPSLSRAFKTASTLTTGQTGGDQRSLEAPKALGDLDNIVTKTLALEPTDRYGTAGELSDDLSNYLRGYPVKARPDSLRYRFKKLVGRNRLATALLALALLGLVSAAVWALREREVAIAQGQRAEALNHFLIEAFSQVDPEHSRGREVLMREVLDNRVRRLDQELNDQPELKAAMLHTLGEVYSRLGLYQEAGALLSRAVGLRSNGGSRLPLAESLAALGHLRLLERNSDDALTLTRQAREIFLEFKDPRSADLLHALAQVEWQADRRVESIALHRQALEAQAAFRGRAHREYVEGMKALGAALRSTSQYEESEKQLLMAVELQQQVVEGDHPLLASLLDELASLMEATEDMPRARSYVRQAMEMNRRLYGEVHPGLAANFNTLGNIEQMSGDPEAAAELYRLALEMNQQLYREDHPRHAKSFYNLATLVHRELGRPEEALALYEEAVASARRSLSEGHTTLGFFLIGLGDCLVDMERPAAGEIHLLEAVGLFEAGTSTRNQALAKSALGASWLAQGRVAQAAPLIEQSDAVLTEVYAPEHRIAVRSARRLARLRAGGSP